MSKILKIGIDARLLTYRRGMGNFIYNLMNELIKQSFVHQFILYVDDPKAIELLPFHPLVQFVSVRPKLYPLWEQLLLPKRVMQDELDILYCPANTAPVIIPTQTRLILTIHDVMYLLPKDILPPLQSRYQRWGKRYRKWIVPYVAKRAAAITTVSEYSRTDLLKQLKIRQDKVKVIYEAQGPIFRKLADLNSIQTVRAKYQLAERVIIAFGAIDPRKNTARVIAAFAQFKAQATEHYQLVLIGLDEKSKVIFAEQAQKLGILNAVIFLNFITEEELVTLYNFAEMMVYPSLYEGFGLPVLEAMACGAPVVTSGITSIPEVAGNAALFVDPSDTAAIASAMLQFVSDPQLRLRLVQEGLERAKLFSWSKAAHELLTVFEEVGA